MVPKADKAPPTFVFGQSKVSEVVVAEFVTFGFIKEGKGRAPGLETTPTPRPNKVVVFWDLFTAGLRFPLNGAIISVLQNFGMYLHHLTPNAVLRLSVYMWASKTMSVSPTTANFVRVHTVHHQPLKIERLIDGALVREEAQFSSLNFKYCGDTDVPVIAYKNKWDKNWNHYWFYYTVDDKELPHVCTQFENLPKGVGIAYEDGDVDRLFLVAFQELAKTCATRNLVEEYIGAKVFSIHAGWSVIAWNDFASAIKIPTFARSFGLTKNGTHISLFFFVASYCSSLTIIVHVCIVILLILVCIYHCSYQRC
jgi:hypothetical protein